MASKEREKRSSDWNDESKDLLGELDDATVDLDPDDVDFIAKLIDDERSKFSGPEGQRIRAMHKRYVEESKDEEDDDEF